MEYYVLWVLICTSVGDKLSCNLEKQPNLPSVACNTMGAALQKAWTYRQFYSTTTVNWICLNQTTDKKIE